MCFFICVTWLVRSMYCFCRSLSVVICEGVSMVMGLTEYGNKDVGKEVGKCQGDEDFCFHDDGVSN